MSPECTEGFRWQGTPSGTETTWGSTNVYVSGSNHTAAVLIVSDVFGWTHINSRLLADHFAHEADVTVYLPDFFAGEVVSPNELYSGRMKLSEFVERNSKEIRGPQILQFARELKKTYRKLGTIGYCYGGWAVFRLGAKDQNLVDCVSTAHPSFLTELEIESIGVPVQILAPETDGQLTPQLKEFCNTVIPSLGLPYAYEFFPRLAHGFATRGDPNIAVQRKGLERAKTAVVNWLRLHLHETELVENPGG